MLSRIDLNRVTAFKSSILKLNKTLYSATEKEVNEYFDFQEDLVKGITDFKIRKELLAQIEPLRVSTLENHKKNTWIIQKVADLTRNDGILDCKSKQEAHNYFDNLNKEIQSIPTESDNIVQLLKLSLEYRLKTLKSIKKSAWKVDTEEEFNDSDSIPDWLANIEDSKK